MTLRNVYWRNVMNMNEYDELMKAFEKAFKESEHVIGGGFVGDSPDEEKPQKDEQKITDKEWEQFCKEEGLVDG